MAAMTCVRRSSFFRLSKKSIELFLKLLSYQMYFLMQNNSSERAVEVLYILSEKTWIVTTVVTEEQ